MRRFSLLLTVAATLGAGGAAFASTDDAWDAFRAEVKEACSALVPDGGETLVEVNAFGSEKFGAAIIYHQTPAGLDRYVCIFDKQTKAAELTVPFSPSAE